MAQEHDLFDDIIEISKGFDFLKNPLGGVTDALDPSAPQWNPADYKERPRGNTLQVAIGNRATRTVINLKERLAETFAQKSIDDLLAQSILGALVKQDIGGAPQP